MARRLIKHGSTMYVTPKPNQPNKPNKIETPTRQPIKQEHRHVIGYRPAPPDGVVRTRTGDDDGAIRK